MIVRVNGQPREVADGTTLADLLAALGYRLDGVAVAVDRQVVPRSELAERRVSPDAQIEVLRAVGGG